MTGVEERLLETIRDTDIKWKAAELECKTLRAENLELRKAIDILHECLKERDETNIEDT